MCIVKPAIHTVVPSQPTEEIVIILYWARHGRTTVPQILSFATFCKPYFSHFLPFNVFINFSLNTVGGNMIRQLTFVKHVFKLLFLTKTKESEDR